MSNKLEYLNDAMILRLHKQGCTVQDLIRHVARSERISTKKARERVERVIYEEETRKKVWP